MRLLKDLRPKARILRNEPLCRHTTFKIGGPVRVWAVAEDMNELLGLFELSKDEGLRILLMGQGSNLLVSSRPLDRLALSLGGMFGLFRFASGKILCGAGCGLQRFILQTLEGGYEGLEFMAGIPGSVGGAIKMNAGSGLSGPWLSDFIKGLKVIAPGGRVLLLSKKDLRFGYRESCLEGFIILEAEFDLKRAKDARASRRQYEKFLTEKRARQELSMPSAGCVFKNPKGSQLTAAQLIEGCGLKGRRIGDAMVSAKHANFIVNVGGATFTDVIELIGLIKDNVLKKYNIKLETEIEILK